MSEIALKGTIIGFEEHQDYVFTDTFGPDSPFRVLACSNTPMTFILVNPFVVAESYNIEIDDTVLQNLELKGDAMDRIAIMCIVRRAETAWYLNMRSPLIINTEENRFQQVVLQNENYPVSMPITLGPRRP